MARWRLTEKHYLNVTGVEWEQVETVQETGRQIRHRHPVPVYLDPADAGDIMMWGNGGELIVSDGNNNHHKDIIFTGPPTPGMEPLDEEAEALTAAARPAWIHPIESLPGQGHGEALLTAFTKQLTEAMVPGPSVSADDFAKLQQQVAVLMARNAELESASLRRV